MVMNDPWNASKDLKFANHDHMNGCICKFRKRWNQLMNHLIATVFVEQPLAMSGLLITHYKGGNLSYFCVVAFIVFLTFETFWRF